MIINLFESVNSNKRKLLLTSTGFDNPNLSKAFLKHIDKKPNLIRALFIITAANDKESKSVLPFCKKDLTDLGIKKITEYDISPNMNLIDLMRYDICYICGGSETHLMKRINETGFREPFIDAINQGLFIIGVSAGSMIFSNSVKNNIPILSGFLEPHCEKDLIEDGPLFNRMGQKINLSDDQAVLIIGDSIRVIS